MLSSLFYLLLLTSVCFASGTPVVTVKNGSYSGVYDPTYNQDFFLGVPYAQPPVNDLRYRVPQSLNTSWSTTRPATAYPPFCVAYGGDDNGAPQSEDCLYLELIRPSGISTNAELPVAVWIHGGGLFDGGSNDPRYNLSFIVQNSVEMNNPMIAISVQYRLSGFGFLGGKEAAAGGATNLGYRDQRLALHWIQENIGAFGGDPAKVTIWGESAGAQSVGVHLLAYNGRDDKLFRSAIAESGGPSNLFFPLDGGYNSSATQDGYNAVVLNTSCASTLSSGDSLSCLRALPFAELNATLSTATGTASSFAPVIDGDLIETYPSLQLRSGAFVPVPLLIGTNTDEGTGFSNGYGPNGGGVNTDSEFLSFLNSTNLIRPSSPASSIIPILYPNIQALGIPSLSTDPTPLTPSSPQGLQFRRLSAYLGDTLLIAPRRATSLAWSTRSIPCYTYRFSVIPSGTPPLIGATHFSEVAFVFNNTRGLGYTPNPFQNAPPSFFSLALLMSRAWVSFITMNDPNNHGISGVVEWPAYNATGGGAGRNLVFDAQAQGGALVEWDTWRGEGVAWIESNALGVYGR